MKYAYWLCIEPGIISFTQAFEILYLFYLHRLAEALPTLLVRITAYAHGMSTTIHSATLTGLAPIKIEVELDAIAGLPGFILIGLPGQTIDEAKERITAALSNCGIKIRPKRVVVNLAPADIRKSGSAFELAIAVGLLTLYKEIPAPAAATIFFGELSLSGELKPVRGILPLVIAAKEMGFTRVFLPAANKSEAVLVSGITIIPLKHLTDYILYSRGQLELPALKPTALPQSYPTPQVLLTDVSGQETAKRALVIAAAGGHNVHLTGPPGAGKSMLAKALCSILPALDEKEVLELTALYSLVGKLPESGVMRDRPFRSPHHTISTVGLLGGGGQLLPGELSLAHRGILFLDELPEFSRHTLESLRQPLEDQTITITRAHGSVTYPAALTVVAASNPCPCGYAGSEEKPCRCNLHQLQQYAQKISGPLLDRIDLSVWVKRVKLVELHENKSPITLEQLREQIQGARSRQVRRYAQTPFKTNAEVSSKEVTHYCQLKPDARQLLLSAGEKLSLSARSFYKTIKVAQTIADLEASDTIERRHIAEGLQYRSETLTNLIH